MEPPMITFTHVIASVFLLSGQTRVRTVQPDCRSVRGQIDAQVEVIRATLMGLRLKGGGSSTGDWSGPVKVEALKKLGGDLEISLRIVTEQGVVSAQGKASAPTHPTQPHTRTVSSDLQVRSVSGLSPLTGTLTIQGAADTRARTIHVGFAGQVCSPQPQSVVDANPIVPRHHFEGQLSGGD